MKPFIAILIGLALLTIALLMGRTSLNHWVGVRVVKTSVVASVNSISSGMPLSD
jgi:hypothetical protein